MKKYIIPEEEEEPSINILPMIDVLFAILIFFIFSSKIASKNTMIPLQLPKATVNRSAAQEKIIISIDRKYRIYIDGKLTKTKHLEQELRNSINKGSLNNILVHADESIEYKYVIRVIDKLSALGLTSLGLGIDKTNINYKK